MRNGKAPIEVGYARPSAAKQDLQVEVGHILKHGVPDAWIYKEEASGPKKALPALAAMFAVLRKGDVVVVWKLDRLGRSLRQVLDVVERLHCLGVGLRVLADGIDTAGLGAVSVQRVFAALLETEQSLSRQRLHLGIASGLPSGRRPTYSEEQIKAARNAIRQGATVDQARKLVTNGEGEPITASRLRVRLKELPVKKKMPVARHP